MSPKLFGLLAILCICGPTSARDKTDVIQMVNGDRITGEIKKLEYGKLRFSTDSMGTLQIEWREIATLSSVYAFEFELSDGGRFFGDLVHGAQASMLIINTAPEPTLLAFAQVVRITPIEHQSWTGINPGQASILEGVILDRRNPGQAQSWTGAILDRD